MLSRRSKKKLFVDTISRFVFGVPNFGVKKDDFKYCYFIFMFNSSSVHVEPIKAGVVISGTKNRSKEQFVSGMKGRGTGLPMSCGASAVPPVEPEVESALGGAAHISDLALTSPQPKDCPMAALSKRAFREQWRFRFPAVNNFLLFGRSSARPSEATTFARPHIFRLSETGPRRESKAYYRS
ncbi:hypothetical protein EVAR_10808_1 [Eumeta japonica]|uniref:Uncharacterized protein n=1 Tax=Eumeta variegata TaxID=151549 RepID=A0A4C1YAV3_EUMVA|nr:hypothetical protein EVAR_10808_1 [Eumeta japonica]